MQNWPENPYWRIFSPHAQGFVPEQPEFRVVETDLRRYHSQDARGNAYNRVSVEPQTGSTTWRISPQPRTGARQRCRHSVGGRWIVPSTCRFS